MAAKRHYDEELRTVGQALEARDINVFVLKQLAENYVIEVMPDDTGSKVRQWLQRLRSGSRAQLLTLARADVERLSQTGKAKRSKWGQLTEFRKLSNTLRTIGAYLDSREVELLELQKRRISITLSYRDKTGNERQEDRSISSFDRLFLELYGKRNQQQKTPLQPNS
jgi:hypothetical protein